MSGSSGIRFVVVVNQCGSYAVCWYVYVGVWAYVGGCVGVRKLRERSNSRDCVALVSIHCSFSESAGSSCTL